MSRSVLVTHADEPIGRRLVKRLYHDETIGSIFATGSGRPPRSFDRFLSADDRLCYKRIDLTRHRPVANFFHSAEVRKRCIDTLVHVPRHSPTEQKGSPGALPGGVSDRTAEARLVLQHALETASIRNLVAFGSAFVYRLSPGNSNRLVETSELDLDPEIPAEIRSWIDCDMMFHGEIHSERLRVTLLRIPTVVASGGYVFLNPSLASAGGPRVRPIGFDPMCALVSDKDVASAARLAIRARRAGIFNIAGPETLPLSVLSDWTGRASLPLPGPLLHYASEVARFIGDEHLQAALDGPHLRYGFTLDTTRAERELGFRAGYRIGLAPAGDGRLRIEAVPA